jgi:hypothetical protein
MMKKHLLIASLALTLVGGGLVGITHAASTDSGLGQTVTDATYDDQSVTEVTYGVQTDTEVSFDDQIDNEVDNEQGNTDDGQKGNMEEGQQNG